MSTNTRGRRRTEDQTPNRARDVQRAFRARRAAHLESLEERIAELEQENGRLREMCGLPPASRPALGKGPTGRGLAKSRTNSTAGAKNTSANAESNLLRADGSNSDLTRFSSPASSASSLQPNEPSSPISPPAAEMPLHVPEIHQEQFITIPPSAEEQDGQPTPISNYSFAFPHNQKYPEQQYLPDSFGLTQRPPQTMATSADFSQEPIDFDALQMSSFYGIPRANEITPAPLWQIPMDVQQDLAHTFAYPDAMVHGMPNRSSLPSHFGHRRSNTEPQSMGSNMNGFAPGHRPSISATEARMVGLPASPPPPSIRLSMGGMR